MCRYAIPYKEHYACFDCRKTFKRKLLHDVDRDRKVEESTPAKCPECGALMAAMGKDFKSPKKDDLEAWLHLKDLYTVGITFHSCGCSGPGYIPRSAEELQKHLHERLADYRKSLRYWMELRAEEFRQTVKGTEKDFKEFALIPRDVREKDFVKKQPAIDYWTQKLKALEDLQRNLK